MRSIVELSEKIEFNIAWRKKELTALKLQISKETSDFKSFLLRAGITFAYAHWEGFIKFSSSAYLEFICERINRKKIAFSKLKPKFQALWISREIKQKFPEEIHFKSMVDLIEEFITNLENHIGINHENIIKTESNLSSKIFKEITQLLRLNYKLFETKEKLIDEKLLKKRNDIAHGEFRIIEQMDYEEIHNEVISMINKFQDEIINNAISETFFELLDN